MAGNQARNESFRRLQGVCSRLTKLAASAREGSGRIKLIKAYARRTGRNDHAITDNQCRRVEEKSGQDVERYLFYELGLHLKTKLSDV